MHPTRRKMSSYVAEQILAGKGDAALRELAAELVASKRTGELELVVRDIEQALARRGTVVADIASAHQLSDDSRSQLAEYIKAQVSAGHVELREHVDPALLGGFRVRVAGQELDASLARKITKLRAQKV